MILKEITEMSFIRFCQDNKIAKVYHDVSIKKLNGLQKQAIQFLTNPCPLKLYGEPGTGKTYFMLTLIRELLETNNLPRHMIRFINALDLDDRVDEDFRKCGSAAYFLSTLKDHYFLFIDDFGIEKSKERAERNYYSLLDDRLGNNLPTVISSNLKEEEVLNIYGARIHSRLKQCITLHFKGEDQRKPPKIL